MSSDILSREQDFNQFSMIYAGSQKNLGPAGVTLIVIRDDMLGKIKNGLPTMIDYRTHIEKKSIYNTPPSFTIYVLKLVLEWIKEQGCLKAIESNNRKKKNRIYNLIDTYPDYFHAPVREDSRSWMNIVFRLPAENLERKFIEQAKI